MGPSASGMNGIKDLATTQARLVNPLMNCKGLATEFNGERTGCFD